MSEKLTLEYNKAEWAKGEWDNEPDRHDFIHAGFSCFILRNRLGAWCGYVGVPREHPAYGANYNDVPVSVHGGLTYGSPCDGYICHVPQPGMPDDVWWFGFDTAHFSDLVPGMIAMESAYLKEGPESITGGHGTYKNMQYVIDEVKDLANQLKEMENDNGR